MIGRQLFSGHWRAALAGVVLVALAGLAPARAAQLDPASMSADEIKALERRLTDAGCYQGAIDGTASPALDAAIKACPDQRPFLRIETGMHTALIARIGVDAACSLLATASDDKTVRLWSLPDGKPKRTIRLPIGEGDAGKFDAASLSPDGRLLAAGGWDAAYDVTGKDSLTIADLSSGAIRRFGAFENVMKQIAFSADGRRIAVGLGGKNGVRVLDSATGAELLADRDYGDSVYGLAFAPDGGLIASSFDGQLRRYGPDLKLTAKRAAPDGKQPFGVAIEPAGRRVAVGYYDGTPVSILDAKTLAPLARAQTDNLGEGDLFSVAWSRNGATLVAGGLAQAQFQGQWRRFLRRFDANGRLKGADLGVSGNTIMDIQPCGDGFAYAAQDPAFGLLSARGSATTLQGPRTADMRDKVGSAFTVAHDAASVRFGLDDGEAKPVLFDLAATSLAESPNAPPGLTPPRIDGLPVTDWKNEDKPKFDGKPLALKDYEISRALAVRPDASGFALGTEWFVRAYDASGKERWKKPGPGAAWGVDVSADGDIIVVAYGDGTIRWLRWSDGAELLALFVEPQSRKWVAWTPTGYYMASAGGEDLIGWHVNRGWTQEADFFPASQFRAQYNRPDIIKLVLKTKDETEAIRQANITAQREAAKPIAAALPPVVTIASPADGFHPPGTLVQIDYSLRSPSGLPIDRLDVLADGRPVEAVGFEKTSDAEAKGRVVAEIPKTSATLSLIAYSGGLTSAPVSVKLARDPPIDSAAPSRSPAAPIDNRPKLYALLIGVTNYEDKDLNDIHFGARDAEGLAEALERQKGGLYSNVETRIVDFPTRGDLAAKVIGPPTRGSVFAGLYWLKRVATDNDLVVVFLSGHGYRDFTDPKGGFWFLTREAKTDELPTTAVSGAELLAQIAALAGKKILFIDACHVGTDLTANTMAVTAEAFPNMDNIVNDFTTAGSGIVVYAASQAIELAHEDEVGQHGAFAEALIEAIGEGKGSSADGRITTDLLDFYIVERVKHLTDGAQHPVWHRPGPVSDFPVALARH
jgi:Caspase domain/WD domain, G-beta repeat